MARRPADRGAEPTAYSIAARPRNRLCYDQLMGAVPTRRAFLLSGLAPWARAEQKGALLPSAWHRYSDPATEFDVLRLTDPAHSSWLPAYYNRTLARHGGFLLYGSDATGALEAYRMDLHNGESRRLTEAERLDAASIAMLADERSILLFGRRGATPFNAGQFAHAANLPGARRLGALPRIERG